MKFAQTRRLALIATVLAFVVILLGAYTRLEDAGLGCPDWPGCYGHMTVPTSQENIDSSNSLYQERALEKPKAWAEMIHRYFAGSLGLVIGALTIMAWMQRKKKRHPVKLASWLLLLVIFQAALGMWTVTMKLNPTIVMLHLLGGFTTFALCFTMSIRLSKAHQPFRIKKVTVKELQPWAIGGLVVLGLQIMLGGWTSANYAATVCTGVGSLPVCQADWLSAFNLAEAYQFLGLEAHPDGHYEFGVLGQDARITIHAMHRIGAYITLAYLLWFAWKLRKASNRLLEDLGTLIAIILSVQVVLGFSNVLFGLPLPIAVAHNGVAALLLISLVAINFALWAHKRRG